MGNFYNDVGNGIGGGLSSAWNFLSGQNGDVRRDSAAQGGLLDALKAAASGQSSAVGMQARQSTDQLVGQQNALAASAPGMAPAAGLRAALTGAANGTQSIAGNAEWMRLQEQERARKQLADYLAALRTQDSAQAQHNSNLVGNLVSSGAQLLPLLAAM